MNFNFSKKILASVGFKKDHGLLYVKQDTEHLGWVATVDHGTQQMNKIEYGVIGELMNPGVWKSIKSRSLEEFLIEVGNIKIDFVKRLKELAENTELDNGFGWDKEHVCLLSEVDPEYPIPYDHQITSMQHNFKMIKLLPKEEQKEIQRQHREQLRKERGLPIKKTYKSDKMNKEDKKKSAGKVAEGRFGKNQSNKDNELKPKFRHYGGELWACMDKNKDVFISNTRPELDLESGRFIIPGEIASDGFWIQEADIYIKDLTYENSPKKIISFIAKEQPENKVKSE